MTARDAADIVTGDTGRCHISAHSAPLPARITGHMPSYRHPPRMTPSAPAPRGFSRMLAGGLANPVHGHIQPTHHQACPLSSGRNTQQRHSRHVLTVFLIQPDQMPVGHVKQYALCPSQSKSDDVFCGGNAYSAAAFTSPTAPDAMISAISSAE